MRRAVADTVERPDRSDQAGRGFALTGPILPADHWAVAAVDRASMLLLIPDHHSAQQALPLEVVDDALRDAAEAAADRSPELGALAEGWVSRLAAEFRGLDRTSEDAPGDTPDPVLLRRQLGIGAELTEGAAAAGLGEFEPHRSGAIPLDDRRSPLAFAHLSGSWTRHVSFDARVGTDFERVRLEEAELAGGFGSWRASVGRKPIGYGSGPRGGVMLSGRTPLDAIQLGTRKPLGLPGFLRPLGSATLHTFLGRLTEDRHADHPYIWGGSLHLQPSRRLTLGINRAALFGGGDEAVTTRRLISMLIGRVEGVGFENQIVSVSGRLVLPTEEVLPATVYFEWGAEDAAGSWWAVPGIIAGITVPSVPRLPGLELGGEYAHFGTSCCGNPSWYRHWSFHGAWAAQDRPLGHPMGGNGRQATAFFGADLASGARLEGEVFARDRGSENLYSPEREGGSFGVTSSVDVRWADRGRLRLTGSHEAGKIWSESFLRMEVSIY